MGSCNCADYDGIARLPGPDGCVYVLQIYHGCEGCDTGPGVMLHRMSKREAETWDADDLPVVPFDAGDWDSVLIPVVDHDKLQARLNAFNDEHGADYDLDGFIHDAASEALRDACSDTVAEWWNEVKNAWPGVDES